MGREERETRKNGGGLKKVALKLFQSCASFSFSSPHPHLHHSTPSSNNYVKTRKLSNFEIDINLHDIDAHTPSSTPSKNLCTICLDPLSYSRGTSPSQAIFTAQCFHSFHFACISSNIRHGGVTCPICRAQWTHLPRNLRAPPVCTSLFRNQNDDPILQILDDSIATFRVQRRSFLRSARYDDDDPIDPNNPTTTPNNHRLHISLSYEPRRPYLSLKLAHQAAIDLVLVASPNGPHLRLMQQSLALVVFSLRQTDRLAIVTYSCCGAARVFPLRRMTSYGKRAALQVIDRLFYTGRADPIEGIKKGVKVLEDRAHENPRSCILHLSQCLTRCNYDQGIIDIEAPHIPIHRFHIGCNWNGFVMREFEEFLGRVVVEDDGIRELELRIIGGGDEEEERMVRVCEMRGGEERRIPLNMIIMGEEPAGSGQISIEYRYVEGECSIRTGRVIVRGGGGGGLGEKRERVSNVMASALSVSSGGGGGSGRGRSNGNGGRSRWDYHDPNMARRWAKRLHSNLV